MSTKPLLVTVLVLAAAVVVQAATPTSLLIVPGRSVGPIVLGMRMTQVFQVLGPPEGREPGDQTIKFFWPRRGLTVRVDRDGRVDAIFVESPAYRTARGVGVGSTRDEVVGAYGPAPQAQEDRTTLILSYTPLGITFAIAKDRGSRVHLVMVYLGSE
ncbi:MAG: hypothetical protein QN163_00935 [Armatimonadota bacterium]|nr:hypothetical protein [Armatimonadota bacterium]MDR5697364.1 hypothetical protein [Armatimonadota bacterium]